ncbi:hypothetical protein JIR23_17690 [Bradyrhizobium diazoefficiens]|nr:hypothetical protein [Bradyrhizobium diazoefficiens]QQN61488.1 hypothetical protein JIR23_17690 [Bradyrhizobium diazoefficiens]
MTVCRDVFSRSKDPDVFRRIAQELYDLPFGAWRPWEEDIFLPAMLRKPKGYVYSETERLKLSELCWFSDEVHGHDGVTVEAMIARCVSRLADMGDEEDWIIELAERCVPFVRRRQLRNLVALYGLTGMPIERVDLSFDWWNRELMPA